jgi:hypothetical protein
LKRRYPLIAKSASVPQLDLLVNDCVVVELKSVEAYIPFTPRGDHLKIGGYAGLL